MGKNETITRVTRALTQVGGRFHETGRFVEGMRYWAWTGCSPDDCKHRIEALMGELHSNLELVVSVVKELSPTKETTYGALEPGTWFVFVSQEDQEPRLKLHEGHVCSEHGTAEEPDDTQVRPLHVLEVVLHLTRVEPSP